MKALIENKRRKIGFVTSSMTEEDQYITDRVTVDVEEPVDDGILRDLKVKIIEMTKEIISKRFARLSGDTKLKKILDYNMLVQIETRLSR